MSLSAAMQTAHMALTNTAIQTGTVSRNIANASNPDYSRRSSVTTTSIIGAQLTTTQRTQDAALFRQSVNGTSAASAQAALYDGLENLKDIFGGNDYETSPAVYLATLRDTLSTYAAKPGEATLAQTSIADAINLANGVNTASQSVQNVRFDTDQEISRQVDKLNELLARFEKANNEVFQGTQARRDVTAALDERDGIIKQISEIIGIETVTRSGNDLALYTKDGTTLFDRIPREVSFEKAGVFSATTTGNPILIDGVPLRAGTGANTTASGALGAMLQIRDEYGPRIQGQLDEIARGLIETFRETDQSAVPTLPDMPGLFTWSGGTVPASGTLVPGLAAELKVNPALIPSLGGNPQLLRDGGINGPAYVANTTGGAGFSARLDSLVQSVDAGRSFDPATGLETGISIITFAEDSIGLLELHRSNAQSSLENREAYRFRAVEAHSKATGVSLDEEMSLLVELEQSYKASARIIAAVDEMLQTLMASV